MGTEFELLISLARARLGPEETVRLRDNLRGPIAWSAFIRLARRHHLVPLCTSHLDRLAPDSVPQASMQCMREYSLRNAQRSLLLTGELRRVLQTFADARISAIAYKGPVLAQQLYGSVALRDMVDLDILVRRSDVLQAREILHADGYGYAAPIDDDHDAGQLRTGCNFPLVRDSTGSVIELHWTPENSLRGSSLEAMWQRCEQISLAGMQVQTFARPDLLLLLCLHGCRHLWERMKWVTDVAELLRVNDVPWDTVLRNARSVGGRRALLVGLVLAHELLSAPLPDEILRLAWRDGDVRRLVREASARLHDEGAAMAHQLGIPFHVFQLRSRERLRDRVRYLWLRTLAYSTAGRNTARVLRRSVSPAVDAPALQATGAPGGIRAFEDSRPAP